MRDVIRQRKKFAIKSKKLIFAKFEELNGLPPIKNALNKKYIAIYDAIRIVIIE